LTDHSFVTVWEPHPTLRGDEHDVETACCRLCGLAVERPHDYYVVDHCPPVEALTREWLRMSSLPEFCEDNPAGLVDLVHAL
jgi:hypothetical protein